jgi:isoaspartyl peptidase/L-asparaginase-like protein (Ntn-hydrolase superfamily)
VGENMRRGDDPETACKKAVRRIVEKNRSIDNIQVGFIAVNKQGKFGGYSIQQGFNFAVCESGNNRLIDATSWVN